MFQMDPLKKEVVDHLSKPTPSLQSCPPSSSIFDELNVFEDNTTMVQYFQQFCAMILQYCYIRLSVMIVESTVSFMENGLKFQQIRGIAPFLASNRLKFETLLQKCRRYFINKIHQIFKLLLVLDTW